MNFRTVFKTPFAIEEVFSLLRIMNGIALLIYYTFALTPNWSQFFSSSGYVVPEVFAFYPDSWVFSFWSHDTFKLVLFILCYLLIFLYTLGIYVKPVMLIMIPLHIGFHLANPLIIHEPQQLTNLLLVILFFLPIEEKWAIKPGRDFWPALGSIHKKHISYALLTYLGIYYFFAGAKKIPDPHWISGSAVKLLASWPFLSTGIFFNELMRVDSTSKLFSWLTLLFELGFIFLAFGRWKRHLIYTGILFHAGVSLTLDVGQFFWAMVQWYPLLLISKSTENQDYLFSR